MGEKVDYILYNANVVTLDPQRPRAQLVAIKNGRIAHVGRNDDLKRFEGRRGNCRGQTLVPGFNDAHCHIMAFASSLLSVDCSPPRVGSIYDLKAVIRKRAQELPEGSWIRAVGYNEFCLSDKRHPTRQDLDDAAPRHPVRLVHRSRHACVLNSVALSLAGITNETPEPPGGLIERDVDTGEPNGMLYEMDSYLDGRIPPLSAEELEEGIRLANEQYLSHGITSLQDATAHNGLREWETLCGLREKGLLTPRISVMMGISSLDDLQRNEYRPRHGDDGARMGALKVMLSHAKGSLHPTKKSLEKQVLAAHGAGYQVALHAIEDRTVKAAIAAFERLSGGLRDRRHRIEHCSLCPEPLLDRLIEVHALVVTNPSFVYYSGDRYLQTVPKKKHEWLYRTSSFLKNGLRPAAGSDSPVVPLNPLVSIHAAVNRRTEGDEALLPRERVLPAVALEMHTKAAAYAAFDEKDKGSIQEGKLADFALLSADPTRVPPEEIKDIEVRMTMLGGEVVWRA